MGKSKKGMWHLIDKCEFFTISPREGFEFDVVELDYKWIPKFVNQKNFDIKRVQNLDAFFVEELYLHGSLGCTTTHFGGKVSCLMCVGKDFLEYTRYHEYGHATNDYFLNEKTGKYEKLPDRDKGIRESQADLFMVDMLVDTKSTKSLNKFGKSPFQYINYLNELIYIPVDDERVRQIIGNDSDPTYTYSKDIVDEHTRSLADGYKKALQYVVDHPLKNSV